LNFEVLIDSSDFGAVWSLRLDHTAKRLVVALRVNYFTDLALFRIYLALETVLGAFQGCDLPVELRLVKPEFANLFFLLLVKGRNFFRNF